MTLKDLLKKLLRVPADALLASAKSLPERVDDCLRTSPVLAELLNARPAAATPGAFDGGAEEGTGPYVQFCEDAAKLGLDVNDYLEQKLEWGSVRPFLERFVLPHLRPDSVVCELGPGTGRWSREILKALPDGQLHLVDYSPWFLRFLAGYFRGEPRVHLHQTNGFTLPFPGERCLDLVVSFGTFIMLKLGNVCRYAREFYRVLRPGCHFVVEYIDVDTPEGWEWLQAHAGGATSAGCFTYYTPDIMARVFASAGLEVLDDDHVARWHPEYTCRILTGRRPG